MNKTQIEWVRNPDGTQGYTWNPITGCLQGCPYCYARKLAEGRLRHRMESGAYLVNTKDGDIDEYRALVQDPFSPRYWPDRIAEPKRHRKPAGIFTCSMGELFGPWLHPTWTGQVMDTIIMNPQHRFYLLTKQPQELANWGPFPDNAWVGVSMTGQEPPGFAGALLRIEAKVKFISYEPLLAPAMTDPVSYGRSLQIAGINWIIIGAQTKPTKQPDIRWVRDLLVAAHNAGNIPVFMKDSLRPLLQAEWQREPRQEMPELINEEVTK